MPENTNFHLQHDNVKYHTNLLDHGLCGKLQLIVLPDPTYCLDLLLSDFHLFGLMNELQRQHFHNNDSIFVAVQKRVTSNDVGFYICKLLYLLMTKKCMFCNCKLAWTNIVNVQSIAVVVSMIINRSHYFRSTSCTYYKFFKKSQNETLTEKNNWPGHGVTIKYNLNSYFFN